MIHHRKTWNKISFNTWADQPGPTTIKVVHSIMTGTTAEQLLLEMKGLMRHSIQALTKGCISTKLQNQIIPKGNR